MVKITETLRQLNCLHCLVTDYKDEKHEDNTPSMLRVKVRMTLCILLSEGVQFYFMNYI